MGGCNGGASEIQAAVSVLHHSKLKPTLDWSWSPYIHTLSHADAGCLEVSRWDQDCPGDTSVTSQLCR